MESFLVAAKGALISLLGFAHDYKYARRVPQGEPGMSNLPAGLPEVTEKTFSVSRVL